MNANQDNLGEQVYVTAAFPNGLTLREFHGLTERQRREHTWRPAVRGWMQMCEPAPKQSKARAGD